MDAIPRSGSLAARDFLFLAAICQLDRFSPPLLRIVLTEMMVTYLSGHLPGCLCPDYFRVRDVRNEFRIHFVEGQV